MYMKNPINIEIKSQKLITDNIKHELYRFEEFYKQYKDILGKRI